MVDTPAKSADNLTVGMLAQRLDGMDKASDLLQSYADQRPTTSDVAGEVRALRELTFEKLSCVHSVFAERRIAVEAALVAQVNAAAKVEKYFGDQISQTAENLSTQVNSLQTQINDTKIRLTAVESRTVITKEATSDSRAMFFAVIGAIIGIGGLLFGLITMIRG